MELRLERLWPKETYTPFLFLSTTLSSSVLQKNLLSIYGFR